MLVLHPPSSGFFSCNSTSSFGIIPEKMSQVYSLLINYAMQCNLGKFEYSSMQGVNSRYFDLTTKESAQIYFSRLLASMYHNFSVVTSISVVREDDPPEMREKLEQEYEKYSVENVVATATTPKFEFYLYNDEGDLVRG